MFQDRQFMQSQQAIEAIRDDIARTTGGWTLQWVMVHEIAARLGLADEAMERALRLGLERGWFVGDGEPPHSIRFSASLIAAQMSDAAAASGR